MPKANRILELQAVFQGSSRFRPVTVTWVDAWATKEQWSDVSEIVNAAIPTIITRGWLISATKKWIKIARDIEDKDTTSVGGVISIPTNWKVNIKFDDEQES